MSDEVAVDARGLLPPWPALRLSRAARAQGGAGALTVLIDDEDALRDVEALCRERRWKCAPDPRTSGLFRIDFD